MNKRMFVAVASLTILTVVPPMTLGFFLFRFHHVSILRGLPFIVVASVINTFANLALIEKIKPWVHGYDSCCDLTADPGTEIPAGSRIVTEQGEIFVSIKDEVADENGKAHLLLRRVLAPQVPKKASVN